MEPSTFLLILKIHLQPLSFLSKGETKVHVLFLMREFNFSSMTYFYFTFDNAIITIDGSRSSLAEVVRTFSLKILT